MIANVPVSLTEMMRERTHSLHGRAERSGVINDILRGKVSRYAYALMLRNLLPAYQQLETGLEAKRSFPPIRCTACRDLYRSQALVSDLKEIIGTDWAGTLPLLAAGETYALRIVAAGQGDGSRLIAHAYTRYFGDLSGGQVLKGLLIRAPGLRPQELSFFEFPQIVDVEAFKKEYRLAINESAAMIADTETVVAEATAAFELNIAVSEAVHQAGTVLV